MRIVCLNAWGGRLHDALVGWLREVDPDVLCLQEVVHTPDAPSPWLEYRDGDAPLPQRSDLLGDVAAALPGHAVTFCPAACGPLWHGDRPLPSLWGIATWVRRRLPVVAQAQGFVHGAFAADGFGTHPRPRTGHAIRVHGAPPVVVAHMHGLRDPRGKIDTPERAAQARRFLALVGGITEAGDRRVLCGDFNVGPDSETLTLLRAEGLTERVTAGGHAGTRTSHYPKPGRFADYMAVDGRVAAFEVVRAPEVSDHCALILDL